MQSGIIIEPISDETLRATARLYCDVWREPPWLETDWRVGEVAKMLDSIREERSGQVLVAVNGSVVGLSGGYPISREDLYEKSGIKFANFFPQATARVLYIAELATAIDYRGQGVGRKLTEGLIGWANGVGITRYELRTHVEAHAPRHLYASLGFTETKIADADYPERTYWVRVDR